MKLFKKISFKWKNYKLPTPADLAWRIKALTVSLAAIPAIMDHPYWSIAVLFIGAICDMFIGPKKPEEL
jgi:hypothetical protein